MPPLLPEYLSQPVQVAIESSLSVDTDWWTIAGTVAGTLAGALLGGLISHWATVNAQAKIDKTYSAEKVYRLARYCRQEVRDLDLRLAAKSLITEQIGSRPQLSLKDEKAHLKKQLEDLCATVSISFKEHNDILINTPDELRELFRCREQPGHSLDTEEISATTELRVSIEKAMDDIADIFLAKLN
ncbi:hypothetical protein [Vreelandella aquamarina]|uniref:Uncharacterized protein n=1 Tax=Vreelandella aquamarina TaxID=77097 RepID=A0A6F8SU05_9GAMM|nr:hypothetical protein [Halomonas meridiana]BCA91905.1 hypothetical protein HMSLTHF_16800 [Halomonas meridiana]